MGRAYRWFGRPLLKFQDSEKAHLRSLRILRLLAGNPISRSVLRMIYSPKKRVAITVFGHEYTHPFGLAAGMDKNAMALRGWDAIGLGFTEIGGVTQQEQSGNERPRMFRADNSLALVNRMGFNNNGSKKIAMTLEKHHKRHGKSDIPLWVNIGKSKTTPLEQAHLDYQSTLSALWNYADVFVVNVSSPNTPNLRELQKDDGLIRILEACHSANLHLAGNEEHLKPVLIKVAPDLTDEQLKHMVVTARAHHAAGIVVSNTTLERPTPSGVKEASVFAQQGGLSGKPLFTRSTEMIRIVHEMTSGDWPIIGVGGVFSADDAWQKITAGACLVQAYSAFVFEGPSIVKTVVSGIDQRLKDSSFKNLEEAVGSATKNTTNEG